LVAVGVPLSRTQDTVRISDLHHRERQRQRERERESRSGRPMRSSTSAAVVALVVEVVVEMSNHVANGLLASLRVQCVLDRLGRLDQVVDVDAGTVAEDPPEHTRQPEQKRLRQQNDRHPLIVADVTLDDTYLARYCLLVRQVIRA